MDIEKLIVRSGVKMADNGESWRPWVLLNAKDVEHLEDDEIVAQLGMVRYYRGPGHVFEYPGWVWRVGKRVLVQQYCGYDI